MIQVDFLRDLHSITVHLTRSFTILLLIHHSSLYLLHIADNFLLKVVLLSLCECLIQSMLIGEDIEESLVELAVLLCLVVDCSELPSDASSKVAKQIHSVVHRVTCDNLIAVVRGYKVRVIARPPFPRQEVEQTRCVLTLDLVFRDCRQLVERTVNDQCLDKLIELISQVAGCQSTDGAAIDTDLAFDTQSVDKECHDILSVSLALIGAYSLHEAP